MSPTEKRIFKIYSPVQVPERRVWSRGKHLLDQTLPAPSADSNPRTVRGALQDDPVYASFPARKAEMERRKEAPVAEQKNRPYLLTQTQISFRSVTLLFILS